MQQKISNNEVMRAIILAYRAKLTSPENQTDLAKNLNITLDLIKKIEARNSLTLENIDTLLSNCKSVDCLNILKNWEPLIDVCEFEQFKKSLLSESEEIPYLKDFVNTIEQYLKKNYLNKDMLNIIDPNDIYMKIQ